MTWAEKAGTFETVNSRLQSFGLAIPAVEFARPEAQIALDLLHFATGAERRIYDAEQTRTEMAGVFTTDVHHPPAPTEAQSDVAYVAL